MFMIRAIIYAGNGTPNDDYDINDGHNENISLNQIKKWKINPANEEYVLYGISFLS